MEVDWNKHFYIKDNELFHKISHGGLTADTKAGYVNYYGYVVVQIDGKKYPSHRVIWSMINGEIPSNMQVDHINHDRSDNRIENLRLVTPSGQSKNKGVAKNNTSGVIGVNWHKSQKRWQASIKVKGKSLYLGMFDDFFDAVCARKSSESKHGFHKNHGHSVKDGE